MLMRCAARVLFTRCLSALALLSAACGSDSSTGPKDPEPGSIALTLGQSSATVAQGGSVSIPATLTRGGGFTGTVTFAAQGVPAGVTAGIPSQTTTGATTTATITLVVAANAAPGVHTITVRGTGAGVADAQATFTLTITEVIAPNYSLAVAPTSHSVVQGGSVTSAVALTRTGGFAGSVALTLTNAPAGVVGTFLPASTTGTTAELTVVVGNTVAPGSYSLFVSGTAAGMPDKLAPLTLTVTAAGTFTMTAASTASLAQGRAIDLIVTLQRTGGFAAPVSLSFSGVPSGMTATLEPQVTTGTTAVLHLVAAGSMAPGSWPITVRASSGAIEHVATITVTVTGSGGGGAGNASISFAQCGPAARPLWLAVQDDAGPWTVVTPVGNVYHFNVTGSKGAIAYVLSPDADAYGITVQHYTRAELTSGVLTICTAPSTRTHSGSVIGLGLLDGAMVTMGGAAASPNSAQSAFTLQGVAEGANDLIVWRRNFLSPGTTDRAVLRRDVALASGASLGTIDMDGPESVQPVSAPVTVTNAAGGTPTITMLFATGSACRVGALYSGMLGGTMHGFPAAIQRPTDHYILGVSEGTTTSARMVQEVFKAFGPRTITYGPSLTGVQTTNLGGAYKRLRSQMTIPGEYNASSTFQYTADGLPARGVTITTSRGAVSGSGLNLEMPDFTGLAGWNAAWAPGAGRAVSWSLTAAGIAFSSPTICHDGGRTVTATVLGTM